MLNSNIIEKLSKQFKEAVPRSLFVEAVKVILNKMDLVSREEFDIQTKVLARTRQKLEDLEQRVTILEKIKKNNNIKDS